MGERKSMKVKFKDSIMTDKVAVQVTSREEIDTLCDWLEEEHGQDWGERERNRISRRAIDNKAYYISAYEDSYGSEKLYKEDGYTLLTYKEALLPTTPSNTNNNPSYIYLNQDTMETMSVKEFYDIDMSRVDLYNILLGWVPTYDTRLETIYTNITKESFQYRHLPKPSIQITQEIFDKEVQDHSQYNPTDNTWYGRCVEVIEDSNEKRDEL